MKPVTLRDIAQEMGTSIMTISLALRNSPRISKTKRKQIQELAEKKGYRLNAMASALAYQRDRQIHHPIQAEIAWINRWKDPKKLYFFGEFRSYWNGAYQAAEKMGFLLREFIIDEKLPVSILPQVLKRHRVQGLLIPPHGPTSECDPEWSDFPFEEYPVVRLGYTVYPPLHLVASNHLHHGLMAFKKIKARGYRRIAYISSYADKTLFKAGFLMAQTDLPPEERLPMLVLPARNQSHPSVLQELKVWMDTHKPDAVLSDLAILKDMLDSIGYSVPEKVGLAALSVLDGNASAGIFQNSEEIGRAAIETLVTLIKSHDQKGIPAVHREILIKGEWGDGDTLPHRDIASLNHPFLALSRV